MNDTKKLYLPDSFDVKQLHAMYNSMYPNNKVSYTTYTDVFKQNYIGFGYPRSDTCSKCDEQRVNLQQLQNKLKNTLA